jgi:glycosyltransferase involved in cell wall biosynthesis
LRRFLLIARDFPPRSSGGVQRPSKLAKYAVERGWAARVLTAPAVEAKDPQLLAELPPEVEVHFLALAAGLRSRALARAIKLGRPWRHAVRLGLFGDESLADLAETVAAGVRLGRGCELVVGTHAPFSSVIAAGLVARALGVPFVADLRDPWAWAPRLSPPTEVHRAVMRRLETETLARADATVIVTEQMRPLISPVARSSAVVIPNGFDPEDLDVAPEPRRRDRFRVVYAGSLYGPRGPSALLDALERLAPRAAARDRPVELVIAGAPNEHAERLRAAPFTIELRGVRPHTEAVALLRSADAIAVLVGTEDADRHAASAKVYEAVAAGPPVVAWAPTDGEAAAVVEAVGAGWTATEADGLHAAFVEILESGGRGRARSEAGLRRFDRRTIAGDFCALFDRLRAG